MKLPYIKLYKHLGDKKVFIVDGAFIRKNMNIEFTDFAEHYDFPSIVPYDELWLDMSHGHDDYKFAISHMLKEQEFIDGGDSLDEAHEEANDMVRAERNLEFKQASVYKNKLQEIDGMKVWLVDGKQVRDQYFIDFTEGGHDKVYAFIPANEIWIDNDLKKSERENVILHELHERNLMANGMDYESAHAESSKLESEVRKKPRLMEWAFHRENKQVNQQQKPKKKRKRKSPGILVFK